MASTKTAMRSVPPAPRRGTRATRAASPTPTGPDALAKEVDRVLKISKDNPPTRKATTSRTVPGNAKAGPSKPTPSSSSGVQSTASRTTTSRTAPKASAQSLSSAPVPARTLTAPAPKTTSTRTPRAAAATSSTVKKTLKGKEAQREAPVVQLPAWAITGDNATLKSGERAKQAMAVVNQRLSELSSAQKAGYKMTHASRSIPSSARNPAATNVESGELEWTDEKIWEAIDEIKLGLKVLRDLVQDGILKSRNLDVERVAQLLSTKCLSFSLHTEVMDIQITSRPHVLSLYSYDPSCRHQTQLTVSPSPPKTPGRTPAAKAKSASTRLAPSKSSTLSTLTFRKEWSDLLWLPPAVDWSAVDESTRMVIFQSLASAWAVLFSAAESEIDITSALPPSPPRYPTSQDVLTPLVLASSLSWSNTAALIQMLYRSSLANPQLTASQNNPILTWKLFSLLVQSDSEDSSKTHPSRLWDMIYRHITSQLSQKNSEQSLLKQIADMISEMVDWVDYISSQRNENKKDWYIGKSWLELADLWVNIGRKLSDTDIIERASTILNPGGSIAPSTPPRKIHATPLPSTPTSIRVSQSAPTATPSRPSLPSRRSARTKERIKNAEIQVMKICGDLAKIQVLIENHFADSSSDLDAAAVESSLAENDLDKLSDALLSLGVDDQPILEKALRGVKRVRKLCSRIVDKSSPESSIAAAGEKWLVTEIDLAEDLFEASTLLSDTSVADLLSGAISTTLCLTRRSGPVNTASHCLAHLDRGKRLYDSVFRRCPPFVCIDWLRCFSATAYNHAATNWKAAAYSDCLKFADLSCDWGEEALALVPLESSDSEEGEKLTELAKQVRDCISRRYEIQGVCHMRLGDRKASSKSFVWGLLSLSETASLTLSTAPPTVSIDELFLNLKESDSTISRISSNCVYDHHSAEDLVKDCMDGCREKNVPDYVAGLLLERLFVALEVGQQNVQLAGVMLDLGDLVLSLQEKSNMRLRQLRMITRMMRVISTTGVGSERFEELAELGAKIAAPSANDNPKETSFKREYLSTVYILRTLQAYASDPTSRITESASTALEHLQGLIIPPTETPATPKRPSPPKSSKPIPATTTRTGRSAKTPARSVSNPKSTRPTPAAPRRDISERAKPRNSITPMVYDDLPRLTSLLGGLISLLGMLGHTFKKLEALKIQRGILRNQDTLMDEYITVSASLASEYASLGKISRAKIVFTQALQLVESNPKISFISKVVLHLRYSAFLARQASVTEAKSHYHIALELEKSFVANPSGNLNVRVQERCGQIERAALARQAASAIAIAEGDAAIAISDLNVNFRLWSRAAEVIVRIAAPAPTDPKDAGKPTSEESSDPFALPANPPPKGADEPAKDTVIKPNTTAESLAGKHLFILQWNIVEGLLHSLFDLAESQSRRGSVRECEHYLKQAVLVSQAVKSRGMNARAESKLAELYGRLHEYGSGEEHLQKALELLDSDQEGIDGIDIKRIQGEILSKREMIQEAGEILESADNDILGLDDMFGKKDSLLISPRKALTAPPSKEIILPTQMGSVLRQQAWIYREAGLFDDHQQLMARLQNLVANSGNKAEQIFLQARIHMFEAFESFKTDLFMSSLSDSTIALPMSLPSKARDRNSVRAGIEGVLAKAENGFRRALEMFGDQGHVEDIRCATLSLALLHAFQTSLQEGGSVDLTPVVADILATNGSITLRRELLESIGTKFPPSENDGVKWRIINPVKCKGIEENTNLDDPDESLREYWSSVQARHATHILPFDGQYDLSPLPLDWAVISINVTEDRNTMFISRHQNGHDPLVFCLPLDRQGRREGEDEEDLFTYQVAAKEMKDIIDESDATSRNSKNVTTSEGKLEWWRTRRFLDKRLEELLLNLEYVWLGPFKSILSPRGTISSSIVESFTSKIQKVFTAALAGSGTDQKKIGAVSLAPALMECFATLTSKCKDEEVEDFVYFILDIYQFHGVPVAIAELDIDQIGVDVKGALSDMENMKPQVTSAPSSPSRPEHLFLALDKNVQQFPWESIPILRGRPVSRIPSLPFLLDQVDLARRHQASTSPSQTQTTDLVDQISRLSIGPNNADNTNELHRIVNARKVFYILNPSGDLSMTQTHFEPWINQMTKNAGWKGIVGRSPTDLELVAALKDYDLVLYFGHGGAEQYISSYKIKRLPKCAVTMLWGCSSGALKDQGDFDRSGTAYNYVLAGCPALVANLWDVTDRDIDRLSEDIMKKLHLDAAHILPISPKCSATKNSSIGMLPLSNLSMVEAVNGSRDECKLRYLTGAAPVVYGIPVYLH